MCLWCRQKRGCRRIRWFATCSCCFPSHAEGRCNPCIRRSPPVAKYRSRLLSVSKQLCANSWSPSASGFGLFSSITRRVIYAGRCVPCERKKIVQPRIIREDGTPRSPWSIAITCYNGATSDFSFRFCSLQGAGSVAPDGEPPKTCYRQCQSTMICFVSKRYSANRMITSEAVPRTGTSSRSAAAPRSPINLRSVPVAEDLTHL